MEPAKIKAISEAVANIEKTFGKGSIMKAGAGYRPPLVPVISSGILSLDAALGVGGIPKGRIIEIFGPESSGKCLDMNAFILTSSGYKTTEEIFLENGLPLLTTIKEVPKSYGLVNESMEVENTTHFTYNGSRKLRRITTNSGFVFKRTAKHPIRCLSNQGNVVWKWSSEIIPGDYVMRKKAEFFGSRKCSQEEAYGVGLLLADGTFGKNSIQITNDDPFIIDFIENTLSKLFGFNGFYITKEKNGSISYRMQHFDYPIIRVYSALGVCSGVAKDKKIPRWVRELDKQSLISFIRGYLDPESYVSSEGLEVSSASWDLLYQLKLILTQFDITSFLNRNGEVKGYEDNEYWRLTITGADFEKYLSEIGFSSDVKNNQAKSFIWRGNTQVQTNHDSIPFINADIFDLYHSQNTRSSDMGDLIEDLRHDRCRCSHTRLKKILSVSEEGPIKQKLQALLNFYFDKVTENIPVEAEPTFDFAMEKTHTFVADGQINHNTTLALEFVREAQLLGGAAAFVDAEHALDLSYAQRIGVDIENLLVSQPDYGEQALEIVETLVSSGGLDIIIVDSVSALVPRAEIEGEMGDAHMALQARLMSQALRKLTGIVSKTGTTVIFINQLRQKIGIVFGSPETTTGGNALKFYASIRIDIRRISAIKNDKAVIANKTKIKIVKNKVAPPFRETEVTVTFGFGIDKCRDVLDLAVSLGVIKKGGAWFTYGETRWQGADAVGNALREDPIFFESLKAEVIKALSASTNIQISAVATEDTGDFS